MRLWEIFVCFAKIGALTFGGGYAMLPILQKEIIDRKGWVGNEAAADYYAVAQCLPGVIAVNTAALIGHKLKGKPGSVAACAGVALPSFVIILVIAAFIQNILEYQAVQKAFFGVRAVVCALIVQAVVKLWKTAIKDAFGLAVYLAVLALALLGNVPAVALVVAALCAGVAADFFKRRGEGEP